MAALIEVCADSDSQRQSSALSKLSTDFKNLLVSLMEVSVDTFSLNWESSESTLNDFKRATAVL